MGDFQNMLWVRKRVRWVLDEQFRHNRFYHSSASRTQFTSLDLCFHPVTEKLWRRKWLPTPVFLLRESCGQRSLVGCSPWGHTESDATEAILHACMHGWEKELATHSSVSCLENPRDGGAWLAAVYGVAQSWTQLKWFSSSSSAEKLKLTLNCLDFSFVTCCLNRITSFTSSLCYWYAS